jgi:hypothetical protein
VGFSSQAHFTDQFRRMTGGTPFRFRREMCSSLNRDFQDEQSISDEPMPASTLPAFDLSASSDLQTAALRPVGNHCEMKIKVGGALLA